MPNVRYSAFMARYTETIFPVKKVVNLTSDQAERIREYRFAQRLESENEAIRRLIEAGLNATAKLSAASPGSSGSGGSSKPATDKLSPAPPPRKPPRAKPLTMSKEAQIRALRERSQ